jgi:hypothetical protein
MSSITTKELVFGPGHYEDKTYTFEELREIFDENCLVWVLMDRVEELEKPYERSPDDPIGLEHHITDDQIDAAWVYTAPRNDGLNMARATLRELNIFRCEGCDGSGRFEAVGLYENCDCCNGHGWTVK